MSSLLCTMATRVCLRILKRQRIVFQRFDDENEKDVLADVTSEQRHIVCNQLHFLFAKQRKSTARIAKLALLDGYTHEEVADRMGMSASGIRRRLRVMKAQMMKMEQIG